MPARRPYPRAAGLRRRLNGESRWAAATPQPWEPEVARCFAALRVADDTLASGAPITADPGARFQGVLADAITRTGQLAMLRRLAGLKMKGEACARADIRVGNVGIEQTPPGPEFEFDRRIAGVESAGRRPGEGLPAGRSRVRRHGAPQAHVA